jgi:hypothetical protein
MSGQLLLAFLTTGLNIRSDLSCFWKTWPHYIPDLADVVRATSRAVELVAGCAEQWMTVCNSTEL